MERDDWMSRDETAGNSPALTFAIVELMFVRGPASRRTFTWVGLDNAPHFPRLQRYLARLAMSESRRDRPSARRIERAGRGHRSPLRRRSPDHTLEQHWHTLKRAAP